MTSKLIEDRRLSLQVRTTDCYDVMMNSPLDLLTMFSAMSVSTLLCEAQWTTNMVEPRAVIVHLFEWKWTDIALECERFLGPYGYGGVQVSPPNEHAVIDVADAHRPWWERYQPVSYKLQSRSGTEAQFRDMVHRCNSAGVRIYVDVVINHMAIQDASGPEGSGGSVYDPTSFNFPAVPYDRHDFNEPKGKCNSVDGEIHNYEDPYEVRNCNLNGLLDLDTSDEDVRFTIIRYLNQLIEIGVGGFRVDACKHMWPEDVQAILEGLNTLNTEYFSNNSRPFIFQEVINRNEDYERITASEYTPFGMVTEFKYGAYLASGIRKENPLKWFKTFGESWGMLPSNLALVFVDNHDNQRGHGGTDVVTFKDAHSYKMATVFMLAYPYGTVRVMSSYEFHQDSNSGPPSDVNHVPLPPNLSMDGLCMGAWICEHRWKQIRNMIGFHNAVRDEPLRNWWDDGGYQIAFGRGNKAFIVINNGESILFKTLQTGLPAGEYCDILSGDFLDETCTGRIITVNESGFATFLLAPNEIPMSAIYIYVKLDRTKRTFRRISQSRILVESSHLIAHHSFVQ